MTDSAYGIKLISKILVDELSRNLSNCANEEDAAKALIKTMCDAIGLSDSQPSAMTHQKRIRRKRKSKRKIWAQFNIGKWVSRSDMIGHGLWLRQIGAPVEFNLMNETLRRKANASIPEPPR